MDKEYICDCDLIHREAVEIAQNKMIEEELFDRLIDFYKVIADSTRCKILFVLEKHEMCVCDIAYALGMSKSLISHQLKILKENNIVSFRKDGKEVYYTLADEHIKDIFNTGLEHIKEFI